jgi:hypothetical protein
MEARDKDAIVRMVRSAGAISARRLRDAAAASGWRRLQFQSAFQSALESGLIQIGPTMELSLPTTNQ